MVGSYFPELARIARERGILGLYAGLGPVLIRAFPANAALFLGVEMGKRVFDNALWPERHDDYERTPMKQQQLATSSSATR